MGWIDHPFAVKLYNGAKDNDEWPGSDYSGSSVNGVLKYMKLLGLITGWKWAFTHLDAQLGVGHFGPGIAGTNWYSGMIETDSEGYIHVTGQNEGGHCYLFLGVDVQKQAFIIHNSWGSDWGRNGRAFLSFDDYEKLRVNQGEMAFIEGEVDPQSPPPEPEKK